MKATPEVYQGEQDGWCYRIFKNDLGKWVAFRWRSDRPSFVTQEWFVDTGFKKDRTLKANDPSVVRFDTEEECEQELLMMFAADRLDG